VIQPAAPREVGKDIQLLQGQIGEYRRTDQYWLNERYRERSRKAPCIPLWRRSGATRFLPSGLRPHNGIGCYLLQGETLLWERLQRLPTLNGSAEFDLAWRKPERSAPGGSVRMPGRRMQ